MVLRSIAALVCLAVMASTAAAQTALQLQFKEGAEYKTKETISLHQSLKILGQTQDTTNKTTLQSTTAVGKRNEQGDLPLQVTYTTIDTELTLPGAKKVVYNSTTGEETTDDPNFQIILDRLKATKGRTYTVTLDKDNRFKSVSGLGPESGTTREDVQAGMEQTLNRYPSEPVKPGDTWERDVEMPLGAGQVFKVKRRYKYVGPEVRSSVTATRRLEKITATTESIVYAIRPGGAVPGTVTKCDLKVDSAETTILFDPAQGRTVESHDKIHVTGAFTLSIMNMDYNGELDLTIDAKREEQP